MFQKYLIIASKLDLAGINITTHLSQFRPNPVLSSMDSNKPGFDFYLREEEIISDENLDYEKISKYDFVIFASKHQSKSGEKTLSVHAPGNWRFTNFNATSEKNSNNFSSDEASDFAFGSEKDKNGRERGYEKKGGEEKSDSRNYGGQQRKICPTSAQFLKQIFQKLNSNTEKYHLKNYKVTLECTHHGPLIEKPCIFIEIGATEKEWKDRKAGFVVAKTVEEIIQEFKENPYNENAIGIGGPHYCPNFNKIQLNSNIAISHIIPSYVLPLQEEMIQEALNKTKEEIDLAIIDWKGIKSAEARKQVIEILDKLYVRYEKTSNIRK